jgi:isopentenyl-diphosphate delta-isomerase
MEEKESVVLVDTRGFELRDSKGQIRTAGKLDAHRRGLLHLAVSVFIFNSLYELLLQKRALEKYHSPGKWTNTCCTHPRTTESPFDTARRRLKEEMRLECDLKEAFTFLYKADVGNGLTEYEFDHVFVGLSNNDPKPDPAEVSDWKWVNLDDLKEDLKNNPESYTPWLQACFKKVVRYINRNKDLRG